MHEISIVVPSKNPRLYSPEFGKEDRLVALIDPPTDTILMNENVAKFRALEGFELRHDSLQTEKLLNPVDSDIWVESKTTGNQDSRNRRSETGKKAIHWERRARIDESQRQIAEINISHDGNTAVAVCIASVEQGAAKAPKLIVDDGSSPPMHEPQWGDQAFLQTKTNQSF